MTKLSGYITRARCACGSSLLHSPQHGFTCPKCEPDTGKRFVVKFREAGADTSDGCLYWSNMDGWVDRESADLFTETDTKTLRLPLGGAWKEI